MRSLITREVNPKEDTGSNGGGMSMVRVLFLVAPFKRHMIARMVEEFSSDFVCGYYPPADQDYRMDGKWARFRATESFKKALASFEPDVVYSDSTLDSAHYHLAYLRKCRKPPLVQHLRGDLWREFWDWYSLAGWKDRAAGVQTFAYNWGGLLFASKLAPICVWLDRVASHYLPGRRSEVVYQGVDPAIFFYDTQLGFRRPAVGIIQNHAILSKVRGLIEFKDVIERLPDVNFYIAEGERSGQSYLGSVKTALAPLANVHFVKGIDRVEMVRRMLSSVDCYVLASGLDCCPTTVLEASLMQLPVIASRVGGVPEIIMEGQTGWSIANSATKEWAEKIRLVVNDTSLGRALGREGRCWVTEKFGWPRIAEQVQRLLLKEVGLPAS